MSITKLGDSFDGDSQLSTSFIYSDLLSSSEENFEIQIELIGGSGDSDKVEVYQFNSMSTTIDTEGRLLGTITLDGINKVIKSFILFTFNNAKIGLRMVSGSSETPIYFGVYNNIGTDTFFFNSLNVAGDDTELQFNDGGILSGDPDLTWDKINNKLNVTNIVLDDGSNNINIGIDAGQNITIGSGNINIGINTGKEITTGYGNVNVGTDAGQNITTGSNNITIGNNVNAVVADGDNFFNIGNMLQGDLTIGEFRIHRETSTNNRQILELKSNWVDSADATRKGQVDFRIADHANEYRTAITIEADGTEAKLSFFGINAIDRHSHIIDADGTLSHATSRINGILSTLEGYGLLKTS